MDEMQYIMSGVASVGSGILQWRRVRAQTYWTTWPQLIPCLSAIQWHAGRKAANQGKIRIGSSINRAAWRSLWTRMNGTWRVALFYDWSIKPVLLYQSSACYGSGTIYCKVYRRIHIRSRQPLPILCLCNPTSCEEDMQPAIDRHV
uniref:Zf-RVT domain-containing protein n=1 Tax=Mesocestoides corti TaxID=53468 RepID=A0A5K3FZY0_MESCO